MSLVLGPSPRRHLINGIMRILMVVQGALFFLTLSLTLWFMAEASGDLPRQEGQFRLPNTSALEIEGVRGVRRGVRRVKKPKRFLQDAVTSPPAVPPTSLDTALAHVNAVKDARFLPLLTVVQFGNEGCGAGLNGTCLTAEECAARGGRALSLCASSFGVCCMFMATCGQSTNINGTYFVNPDYPSGFSGIGSCQLTIHKSHPDVCQYRLDFAELNLMGPEPVNHMCNTDQLIVSGGSPTPTICGINTGNHMYVDAGSSGNSPITLTVVTSGSITGAAKPRNWKIKISHIPCASLTRAEEGCTQYYTGVSGQIKTYNYDGGLQLSNQDYSSCVRVERNFCSIQYTQCQDTTNRTRGFALSGITTGTSPVTSMIGGIGPNSCQGDWIVIPCAANVGRPPSSSQPQCIDRICGGTFNSEVSTTPATVYSTVKPFRIALHTDNVEAPNDAGNTGFCLNFVQQPCANKLN